MATQTAPRTAPPAPPLQPFKDDTIPKLFLSAIDAYAGGDAMRYNDAGSWRGISHQEVERQVAAVAAWLEARGIQAGDRVAILAENRPEWQIVDFAAACAGVANVAIYATLPPQQIHYILQDAGVRGVFVSTAEQLQKIAEVRGDLPGMEWVVGMDAGGADVVRWDEVLREGTERVQSGAATPLREMAQRVEPEQLATLIYTSGTTGNPKGVMLTHHNLASNVAATRQFGVMDLRPREVALSFLPLSHVFERTVDLYYWSCGVTIAYVDAVEKVAASLIEVQPHVAAAAPRVFEKIYAKVMGATGIKRSLVMWAKRVGEAAVEDRLTGRREGPHGLQEKLADRLVFSKLRARTGGNIRAFVSGSAPLSADIAKFFWAAGLPIYEGYGLTETSPVLTCNRPGHVRLGSVGQALPGTEVRIAESGEILARGPQVMQGYYNNAAATAEVIDADGWFHTGDVGEIDADGFLRITDRIKNILVTAGGKNIAPQPIENLVAMSPYIANVVMLGDKRAFPTLLLVPDFENLRPWLQEQGIGETRPEELARNPRVRDFLEQEAMSRLQGLARYETPKKVAIVPRDFSVEGGELTPSLKVRRKTVEENYRELIEGMYEG